MSSAWATVPPMKEDDKVYATLSQTLLAGALPSGTQLIETRIAALFGVSRERVRKTLHRLGHERLLELVPNKGAFVKAPDLEQARAIYEARRVVEGGVVARLAHRLSRQQLAQLHAHLAAERRAAEEGNRVASIRLSGEFHLVLAQATLSDTVIDTMRELVSKTAMLVALFEESNASHCGCEEHVDIVEQLEKGDVAAAVKSMYAHLSLIETRLNHRKPCAAVNAEEILREAWQAVQHGTG
jgi:DNA-binding GntR family transcriptional regulator